MKPYIDCEECQKDPFGLSNYGRLIQSKIAGNAAYVLPDDCPIYLACTNIINKDKK